MYLSNMPRYALVCSQDTIYVGVVQNSNTWGLTILYVILQILIDTIDALAEAPQEVVQRPEGVSEANVVDICAVALYMFAQLYMRQAQRADAMDVWPSSSPQAAAAAFAVSITRYIKSQRQS